MRDATRIVTLLLPLLAACKGSADAPGKTSKPGLVFAADVMPVEAKKVVYLVNAPGTLEAFEHVQVTARVAGAVDKVAFTEGQDVKKGDLLVLIDSARYRVAFDSARADVNKADAALKDAQAMVSRREAASTQNPGLVTGEEIASYKTKVLTAKGDLDVATQALRTAELNLRDATVRAPMDGIMQTRTIETGQYMQPGYLMATLLRRDPLLLRFQVEPLTAPRLDIGKVVSFTMRETQRVSTAKITLVSGAADSATHMVSVTGQVDDQEHKFWRRPGAFCDVSIDLSAENPAPMIPRVAARATDHGYVAYVVDGDVAHEHVLALGMNTSDGWIEVRSGLAAGDLLVVHGAEALTEGAKVKATHVTAASLKLAGAAPTASAAPAAGTATGEPTAHPAPKPSGGKAP